MCGSADHHRRPQNLARLQRGMCGSADHHRRPPTYEASNKKDTAHKCIGRLENVVLTVGFCGSNWCEVRRRMLELDNCISHDATFVRFLSVLNHLLPAFKILQQNIFWLRSVCVRAPLKHLTKSAIIQSSCESNQRFVVEFLRRHGRHRRLVCIGQRNRP
jgi:hypothetical protein